MQRQNGRFLGGGAGGGGGGLGGGGVGGGGGGVGGGAGGGAMGKGPAVEKRNFNNREGNFAPATL